MRVIKVEIPDSLYESLDYLSVSLSLGMDELCTHLFVMGFDFCRLSSCLLFCLRGSDKSNNY